MSAAHVGLVIASYRGGSTYAPLYETFVIVPLILAMTAGCVLIAIYLRRHNRRHKPLADEWQALAVMGELCPHGWQAEITVRGYGAPIPDDAPASRVPLVELEWKQFDEDSERIVVSRRVWAPTIGPGATGDGGRSPDRHHTRADRAGRRRGGRPAVERMTLGSSKLTPANMASRRVGAAMRRGSLPPRLARNSCWTRLL